MEDQGKRILLFVVIAAAIFVVFQWVSPTPEKETTTETTAGPTAPPPETLQSRVGRPAAGAETPAAPTAPAVTRPAAEEPPITLATEEVEVTFSSVGGVVREWRLRQDPFKGRDMDEAQFMPAGPGQGLVAVNFIDSTHVIPVDAIWTGKQVSDTEVHYTYDDGVIEIIKRYVLLPEDYLVKINIEVHALAGELKQQLAVSLYSAGDGLRGPLLKPACHLGTASSKHPDALKPSDRERSGRVRFVGFARSYSLIALSPRADATRILGCFRATLPGVSKGSQVDLVYPPATFAKDRGAIGEEMVLYVGPKYFDRLEGADELAGWSTGMKSVIDLGWFSFIARPMLWLLHQLFNVFGNWGVAIILLTFLVKLATLYWTTKSMRSMKAMAALKPEMEAIQKRYPDDRQKQQQAQMALFKTHGVSPLAGCLPMLLQMPIWIALYRMLSSAGELHHAAFIPGWLDDLTVPDPYFILPITLTGMMFLQSKLQPATGDSMQQKMLMYGMPIMFGGMSLFFPSGLTVYIFTNTVLGILHSLWMNRTTPAHLAALRAAGAAKMAAAAAKEGEATKLAAEVRRAKPVSVVVSDPADDEDDEGDEVDDGAVRRPTNGSKGSAGTGGAKRRAQRRGKRRG